MTAYNLLSLAEAAELAGVAPVSLRAAIRDGRLAGVKIGRNWCVERDEIARYVAERRPNYERSGVVMYTTPSLPTMWIVEHDRELWMVPSVAGGWERRKPYHGHRDGLALVNESTARLMRATCGIPA